MMASERSRSQRQEWIRLSEHYSQFLHHYQYLVTQLIHMHIDLLQQFREVREKLLETERVEALQEEIAGFLLDQVIDPN